MSSPADGAAAAQAPAAAGRLERAAVASAAVLGVGVAVQQLFNLRPFGLVLIEGQYLYLLAGLFLFAAYLCFRSGSNQGPATRLDWGFGTLGLGCCLYFAATAERSLDEGWEYAAPEVARWVSLVLYLLILEITRRAGGWALFAFVLFFSIYPTFADRMPDPLNGFAQPFWDTVPYHMISAESSFGIPMQAFGNLVIGFILFGTVLQRTGGGTFFNDLAMALVGRYRGGAAKVAIFASGFMGSMSGSVISNVLSTGAVSIPAMKRTGFEGRTAAATEACASTGGVLMPPIMGATAFVMASFLAVPYVDIALAAAIPSLLFYFALFVQIDGYAMRRGLSGLAWAELPRMAATLRSGWPYLAVFALLIFLMVGLKQDTLAPFYATALLLAINQVLPRRRLDRRGAFETIYAVGRTLAELTAVLLGIGLIVGAFSATGLAGTLVNDLIFLAGDSTLALLAMGAVTAFVFGMGMTVTACYIFLAVVLAPALEQAGLNRIAVHLFILYWGMVSYITPPVALGAFAAATLAGAGAFRTGLEAMRLGGIVIYVVPFFFVLNPALVGQAGWVEVVWVTTTALVGVWMLGGALQGQVSLVGPLDGWAGRGLRAMLGLAGLVLAMPANEALGIGHLGLAAIGAALAAPPLARAWSAGRAAAVPAAARR